MNEIDQLQNKIFKAISEHGDLPLASIIGILETTKIDYLHQMLSNNEGKKSFTKTEEIPEVKKHRDSVSEERVLKHSPGQSPTGD